MISDDLALALHLADVAAEVTMASFGSRLPVTHKDDSTPVTEIDQATERAIRRAVAEHRPNDGVLGEEEGLREGTSGRVWVIDPIDGTRMYAEGIPLWTTLIGLRDDTGVTVSVADAAAIGERIHATRGGGAWLGDRHLAVSTIGTLRESFVVHSSVEEYVRTGQVEQLTRFVSTSRGSRGLSDAWGHLLVARGSAEAMVEATACYEWDWAATSLIVEEAGGVVSAVDALMPSPGCRLLVTNGLVDAEVREALRGYEIGQSAGSGFHECNTR